ncbi:MAG TPA: VOC family protein [Solirubrobacteraceae bacterium]|nr:VOC family protein [Solirubrobacteraceae bacterium]
MSDERPPSVFRDGGASYLHIPCHEPARAADFYEAVFGWSPRRDGDQPAFADATGHVIGHFMRGEPAPGGTGVLPYIYVDDLTTALRRVEENGGALAEAPRPEGTLRVARIHDPEGNTVGVWTQAGAGDAPAPGA